MVTLVMGFGIGVVSTVGLTIAAVGTMASRVESVFDAADEESLPVQDDFAHLR